MSFDTSELLQNNRDMATVTLSAFLRTPNEIIERLDEGDVVLTRREGESLRVSKESNRSAEYAMVNALSQLIAGLTVEEDSADRVATILQRGPFPWLEFFNDAGRREFVAKFIRTAHACADVQRFEALSVVVGNWRETALALSLGMDREISEVEHLDEPVPARSPKGPSDSGLGV